MKKEKNVVIKKDCHSRMFLSGISRVLSRYVHKGNPLSIQKLVCRRSPIEFLGDDTYLITVHGSTPTVMLNSFQHPLHFLCASKVEILNQVQDDNRRGFTLIELLVVVLIIGILAAVAVPQYRLAVAKSRYMQLIVLARAFYNAQQVYALNNGAWTADLEKLDIALPVYDANTKEFYESEKKKFYCLYGHGDTEELYCGFSTGEPRLWLLRSKEFQPHCYFDTTATDAALAEKVCKSVCNGITPVAWYGNVKFCTIKS